MLGQQSPAGFQPHPPRQPHTCVWAMTCTTPRGRTQAYRNHMDRDGGGWFAKGKLRCYSPKMEMDIRQAKPVVPLDPGQRGPYSGPHALEGPFQVLLWGVPHRVGGKGLCPRMSGTHHSALISPVWWPELTFRAPVYLFSGPNSQGADGTSSGCTPGL